MSHIKQITGSNKQYATKPHIDILFVCVDKEYQGKGYTRHLVEAAKKYAEEESVPLLFDTDMERYALHRYINIMDANYIIRHWQVMVLHDIT